MLMVYTRCMTRREGGTGRRVAQLAFAVGEAAGGTAGAGAAPPQHAQLRLEGRPAAWGRIQHFFHPLERTGV